MIYNDINYMVQMAIRKWMNFTFGHEKQIRTQEKEKSGSVLMCEHIEGVNTNIYNIFF